MTNFDNEIDRIFKKMSSSFFNTNDIFEEFKGNGSESGLNY
ncbi:MAG: Hsp20/alpha crystallin family protein, partial [Nitrosopumilus sp.]|nr:Hsp20/alpha crystallin family protein [Nitrosopumilus sp.]